LFSLYAGSQSISYATTLNDTIPNNLLMYHRFGESKYPSTNTTTEQVEQHLSYLKDKNFNFILAKDLLNPEVLSTKTISITVDDAYLSFYEVGLPIFEKFNIPVTLFLNTENVGGNNYMSWSQLKETLNRGVDIQNHTHSHSSLSLLTDEEIINEIEKSQSLIFDNLGIVPNLFAYPFGENSLKAQKIVSEYFDAAFGQHSGAFSIDQKYYIPRFPLNENYGSLDRIRDAANALPFSNASLLPIDPHLNPATNRFVLNLAEGTQGVNCFISDFQGSIEKTFTTLEDKLLIELDRMPVKGRLRFNCTKVNEGVYWYGFQYVIN